MKLHQPRSPVKGGILAERIGNFKRSPPAPRADRHSSTEGATHFWWQHRQRDAGQAVRKQPNKRALFPVTVLEYNGTGLHGSPNASLSSMANDVTEEASLRSIPASTETRNRKGAAIQALQRLAASNPKLYKALLGMKKDSQGRISTTTLAQVQAAMESAASAANSRSTSHGPSRAHSPDHQLASQHSQVQPLDVQSSSTAHYSKSESAGMPASTGQVQHDQRDLDTSQFDDVPGGAVQTAESMHSEASGSHQEVQSQAHARLQQYTDSPGSEGTVKPADFMCHSLQSDDGNSPCDESEVSGSQGAVAAVPEEPESASPTAAGAASSAASTGVSPAKRQALEPNRHQSSSAEVSPGSRQASAGKQASVPASTSPDVPDNTHDAVAQDQDSLLHVADAAQSPLISHSPQSSPSDDGSDAAGNTEVATSAMGSAAVGTSQKHVSGSSVPFQQARRVLHGSSGSPVESAASVSEVLELSQASSGACDDFLPQDNADHVASSKQDTGDKPLMQTAASRQGQSQHGMQQLARDDHETAASSDVLPSRLAVVAASEGQLHSLPFSAEQPDQASQSGPEPMLIHSHASPSSTALNRADQQGRVTPPSAAFSQIPDSHDNNTSVHSRSSENYWHAPSQQDGQQQGDVTSMHTRSSIDFGHAMSQQPEQKQGLAADGDSISSCGSSRAAAQAQSAASTHEITPDEEVWPLHLPKLGDAQADASTAALLAQIHHLQTAVEELKFQQHAQGQCERPTGSYSGRLPDQDHHSGRESCLGSELLSQLAGLSLSAALLERDHPLPVSPSHPAEAEQEAGQKLIGSESHVLNVEELSQTARQVSRQLDKALRDFLAQMRSPSPEAEEPSQSDSAHPHQSFRQSASPLRQAIGLVRSGPLRASKPQSVKHMPPQAAHTIDAVMPNAQQPAAAAQTLPSPAQHADTADPSSSPSAAPKLPQATPLPPPHSLSQAAVHSQQAGDHSHQAASAVQPLHTASHHCDAAQQTALSPPKPPMVPSDDRSTQTPQAHASPRPLHRIPPGKRSFPSLPAVSAASDGQRDMSWQQQNVASFEDPQQRQGRWQSDQNSTQITGMSFAEMPGQMQSRHQLLPSSGLLSSAPPGHYQPFRHEPALNSHQPSVTGGPAALDSRQQKQLLQQVTQQLSAPKQLPTGLPSDLQLPYRLSGDVDRLSQLPRHEQSGQAPSGSWLPDQLPKQAAQISQPALSAEVQSAHQAVSDVQGVNQSSAAKFAGAELQNEYPPIKQTEQASDLSDAEAAGLQIPAQQQDADMPAVAATAGTSQHRLDSMPHSLHEALQAYPADPPSMPSMPIQGPFLAPQQPHHESAHHFTAVHAHSGLMPAPRSFAPLSRGDGNGQPGLDEQTGSWWPQGGLQALPVTRSRVHGMQRVLRQDGPPEIAAPGAEVLPRAAMPGSMQRLHSWTQHGQYLPHQQASPNSQHEQYLHYQQATPSLQHAQLQHKWPQPAQFRHDRGPLPFQQPAAFSHRQHQQGYMQARHPIADRQGHQAMHSARQANSLAAPAGQQHLATGTPVRQAQAAQATRPAQFADRQGDYMRVGTFQQNHQISVGYPVQHFQPMRVSRPADSLLYRQNRA